MDETDEKPVVILTTAGKLSRIGRLFRDFCEAAGTAVTIESSDNDGHDLLQGNSFIFVYEDDRYTVHECMLVEVSDGPAIAYPPLDEPIPAGDLPQFYTFPECRTFNSRP